MDTVTICTALWWIFLIGMTLVGGLIGFVLGIGEKIKWGPPQTRDEWEKENHR